MQAKDFSKKISDKVEIVTITGLAHGGGSFDCLALGSDKKIYRWDYIKGVWLCNWESKEEKAARLKAEDQAKKMHELQKKLLGI